jgi:hypothetical protein
LAGVSDPAPVGQGIASSAPALTGTCPGPTCIWKLFVGDMRPQQVIVREGLQYIARTVKMYDAAQNPLGTSTVMYDLIKQLAPSVTTTAPFTVTIANPGLVLETQWFTGTNAPDPNGFGFYAPMFDVPASVVQAGSISPINVFPWLEKLFVGMTASATPNLGNTFPTSCSTPTGTGVGGGCPNDPSLWDFRPGDDAYDTTSPYLDPFTGKIQTAVTLVPGSTTAGNRGEMVPFGMRGGAATDPNNLSLWEYGAFAKKRQSGTPGPGQWGTALANYALNFPAVDPYGNDNAYFADVPATHPFFVAIQIAKNVGIAAGTSAPAGTACSSTPVINPPGTGNGAGGITPGPGPACQNFGPDTIVTRAEMARWIVLSQMDEQQVSAYLCATGGDPSGVPAGFSALTCPGSTSGASSFADVDIDVAVPGVGANTTCTGTSSTTSLCGLLFSNGVMPPGQATNGQLQRYIEVMYRRGYTKGCSLTFDGKRNFCPNNPVLRRELAVFLIRAKMNNVFPTSLSGAPGIAPNGDNFRLFIQGSIGGSATSYFTDVPPAASAATGAASDYFIYIQKMRELRITDGVDTSACTNAATGPFPCAVFGGGGPELAGGTPANATLTRQQIAAFVVIAFFQ